MGHDSQVVIVGGGPVGVALAVELGRRGIRCTLVERYLTPQRIPKGQNLTQRTLEHFHFWGIADALRRKRLLPPGYPIGGITAYRDLTSEHWYAPVPPVGQEAVRSYYFEANERLPQYLTEEVLRARVQEIPAVSTLFGWSAQSVEQDGDGVRVVVRETDGAAERVVEADYVVGCDGARSLVREQAGIGVSGTDFAKRMVLAVFRSTELHDGLARFPERTTYRVLDPEYGGYWMFFGRIDVGEGWFFHAPVPDDADADSFDVHALLERAAGFPFSCEIDHVGFWDLRIGIADEYRKGRVLVAGDAAHSHPPYGGFGLNTGLEDAANLGWKLAAVLDRWGGEGLLDSYVAERRPIVVETAEEIIAGGIEADRAFLQRYDPAEDREAFERAWKEQETAASGQTYEPHYEGSPVVLGPPGASCSIHSAHSYVAQAGHHLTPRPLSSGRDVFEELGAGFTLLAFGADDGAVAAFTDAAGAEGLPLTVVRDTWEAERTVYGSRLVLVRPDQYVAWTGDDAPDDVPLVLRTVAGAG